MQAVNNFKNETGYTKHARKLVQNSAPPPLRLQLLRHSRQQDPLVSNASAAASSTTSTQVQAPTPAPTPEPSPPTLPHASAAESQVASPAPPAVGHHSPPKTVNHGEPPPPGWVKSDSLDTSILSNLFLVGLNVFNIVVKLILNQVRQQAHQKQKVVLRWAGFLQHMTKCEKLQFSASFSFFVIDWQNYNLGNIGHPPPGRPTHSSGKRFILV